MKKKFLLATLIITFLLTGCKEKTPQDLHTKIINEGEITIGVKNDIRPFGFVDDDGKLNGYDIDLSKIIAKVILGDENKIKFVPVTTSNRIMMLNSGHVDMIIATMSITPKRREIVEFSQPYYIAGQTFLVPKASDIKSVTDLRDKKIIMVFGSTAEKNLRLILPEAKLVGFRTYAGALAALKANQASAMAADDTILLGILERNSGFRILPKRYTKEPYAIGFRKGEDTVVLKEQVDTILTELRAKGELDKLKRKWVKW